MKNLPTVMASAMQELGVEVLEFQGADSIPNRDAVGFYYRLRLQPGGEPSRVSVLFSGTVMSVRPEAFGLPTLGDREATFRAFAETAIGDFLDDTGAPPHTPSGVSAFQIDCFSPHFQAWKDRPPATDEVIERYLFAHVTWAWRFGHASWRLGPPDLLRLNQPLAQVLRIVRLYDGEAWSLSDEGLTGVTLTPTAVFLRQQTKKLRLPSPAEPESTAVAIDTSPAAFVYVDEARIADLRRLESQVFDLRKLVALCEELNQCYRSQCYHAVAALTRAVLDHIPPVFGVGSFTEVANNYAGARSFRECMRHLEEAARKIGDAHLHTHVRSSETLPTRVQVNFSNEVDVLLAEVIRILQ